MTIGASPGNDSAGPDLEALDEQVRQALATGDESGITVLGYGEISAVVAWPSEDPRWACKRLPPFRDAEQLAAYRACLEAYIAALDAGGIDVVDSELRSIETPAGLVAYLVQPALPADRLGPRWMREAEPAAALEVVERVVTRVTEAVSPRVGLDAQLSNWLVNADMSVSYLDLTTPILRDEDGGDRLDADLFLASLPWLMRGFAHRFILQGVLDKYFDPRGVVLDLLGNLHKERLSGLIKPTLPVCNGLLEVAAASREDAPGVLRPITAKEVDRYYRSDARTWALLQRLRKMDRWWQRRVRRRVYPFLIPAHVQR